MFSHELQISVNPEELSIGILGVCTVAPLKGRTKTTFYTSSETGFKMSTRKEKNVVMPPFHVAGDHQKNNAEEH